MTTKGKEDFASLAAQVHSLEKVLVSLATRLHALEQERAILGTLYRYAHSIDYGPDEDFVDCFTEDGAFEVRRRQGPGHREQGRDILAKFMAGHTRVPDHYHKHLVVDPRITLNGNEAQVVSYYARLDVSQEGRPQIRAFGRYCDRMVKCADGVWRFKERIAETESRHGPSTDSSFVVPTPPQSARATHAAN